MKTIVVIFIFTCLSSFSLLSQDNIKFEIDKFGIRKYDTYKDLVEHINFYYNNIESFAQFYVILSSENSDINIDEKYVLTINNKHDFEKVSYYLLNNIKINHSILKSLTSYLEMHKINVSALQNFENMEYDSFVCEFVDQNGVINYDDLYYYELIYAFLNLNIIVTRENYSGNVIIGTEKILNINR